MTLTAESARRSASRSTAPIPWKTSPLYADAIAIASTTTLKAGAFRSGYTPSPILTAAYIIEAPPDDGIPPDPATVAPPLDPTVPTAFADATSFLYTGPHPIQRGVEDGAIVPERVAVVRGQVRNRAGEPLPGVRVTVLNQPKLGHTFSRTDGMYDLAVNGGGPLVIEYALDGFLPVAADVEHALERLPGGARRAAHGARPASDGGRASASPRRRRPRAAPPSATRMAAAGDADRARGRRRRQHRARRRHGAAGAEPPVDSRDGVHGRAQAAGRRCPADLPSTSGYTYAVELSADEAIQAGATRSTFAPALAFYVENFLNFPVGGAVPIGYYDRAQAAWVASNDGRIVRVVGTNADGRAELDIDGDAAADAAALAALGVTDGERQKLATLYQPGQTLWRVSIPHFTPWDCNWPFGPPQGAQGPNLNADNQGPNAPGTRSTERTDLRPDGQADKPTCESGSIVECQNQTLGELLPIAGTPFALAYRSDRVPGYSNLRTVAIPLTNATVPGSLKRVELDVAIAGQNHKFEFAPTPGQSTSFTWNGLDAFGRPRNGQQLATATVSHVYNGVYYVRPVNFERSFAMPATQGAPSFGDLAAAKCRTCRPWCSASRRGTRHRRRSPGGTSPHIIATTRSRVSCSWATAVNRPPPRLATSSTPSPAAARHRSMPGRSRHVKRA